MFVYGLLFSYFVWVPLLVVLGALGVALLTRSVTAPAWMRRGAACAGCGYELTALGDGRCPECGASLVKVGVTTPRMAVRIRGSAFLLVMGWTLIMGAVTLPALGIASWFKMSQFMGGGMGMGTFTGPASLSCTLVPATPEAYTISFDSAMITNDSDTIESGTLSLGFVGTPNPVSLAMDLSDRSWAQLDPQGGTVREGSVFGTGDAMKMYQDAGLNITEEATLEELTYLVTSIETFIYSPEWNHMDIFQAGSPLVAENVVADWSQSGPTQSDSQYNPFAGSIDTADIILIATIGASGLLYLIGLVFFFRKRGRLLFSPVMG